MRDRTTSSRSFVASLEPLERRRLLCAVHAVGAVTSGMTTTADGHVLMSDFLAQHPELQGRDLYSPSTFDPRGTGDPAQYLYDPHQLENDHDVALDYDKLLGIPRSLGGAPKGASAVRAADALPDFFPLMYQVNSNLDLTSQPGRALLKFGTQVNNQGAGPASLISGQPGIDAIPSGAPITSWVNPDGSQNVLQAVYSYTGSGYTLSYYRAAGRFTYHAGHGHFHFDGYADYRLRYRNANGTVGDYVLRSDGTGVVGSKTGFCLLTFSGTFTTESGTSSSTLPGYNQDSSVPSGCGLQQGVRVGKYDQYSSGLEGQWIDVAGVAPGQYFLEITLDGENAILESNETNNAKTFAVTIPNYTTGAPIVEDNFDSGGADNDTFDHAADMGVMGVFNQTALTIHWGLDFDYFEFTAASSGTGSITMTQSNGNVDLYLYDGAHNQIASSTNASGNDAVSASFVAGQSYYVKAQTYNSTTSNNYQLAFNIKPTVVNSAPTATASATSAGSIRISRNGPVSSPLTVNLTYGGTAISGVDYSALPSSVVIGNEASYVDLPVNFAPGASFAANKTVIANVSSNSAYAIGTASATVTLLENVKPVVSNPAFDYAAMPHRLTFRFNEDVGGSLAPSDLAVMNLDTNEPVAAKDVGWAWDAGAGTGVATFFFNGLLPNGHYAANIAPSDVTDLAGNPLSAPGSLNFQFLFGDLNGSGSIDFDDYVLIDVGYNTGLTGYANGDLNHDGGVNFDDYVLLDVAYNSQR